MTSEPIPSPTGPRRRRVPVASVFFRAVELYVSETVYKL